MYRYPPTKVLGEYLKKYHPSRGPHHPRAGKGTTPCKPEAASPEATAALQPLLAARAMPFAFTVQRKSHSTARDSIFCFKALS